MQFLPTRPNITNFTNCEAYAGANSQYVVSVVDQLGGTGNVAGALLCTAYLSSKNGLGLPPSRGSAQLCLSTQIFWPVFSGVGRLLTACMPFLPSPVGITHPELCEKRGEGFDLPPGFFEGYISTSSDEETCPDPGLGPKEKIYLNYFQ